MLVWSGKDVNGEVKWLSQDKMPRSRLRDLSIIQNPPNSEETNNEQQTAIGSSNTPNTADESTEIQTQNTILLPINYESWHHMPDNNKNQALDNIKDRERVGTTSRQKQKFTHTVGSKRFARVADDNELSFGQKVGRLQLFDITHRKKDGSPMTTEAAEIMEKLKDKRAGLERYGQVQFRFQGSFVNPTKYFGSSSQQYMPLGNQAQAEAQRLRDQMAQMQASTIEQIAQLKAEEASKEAEAQRKYEELQLQFKAEAERGKQRQAKNMTNSNNGFRI
ncbi:hypothetical protein GOBAR_AA06422 [Gossypium barbadense]|uniref:Uncharacterized protein n=1 Tax=Gossypium barbadense TaxID=3634 RepID=A0A2P5YF00_GOSBA|nr:hypothetical protein GOBAR_AA06422 [Gossypium barbadense]